MAKKNGLQDMGVKQVASLGGVVLKMLAIGLAGGAALIAGANKAGEAIQDAEAKKADEVKEFDIPLEEIEHYVDSSEEKED